MSTTTTYAVSMTELRAEPQHGSLWTNYGNPVPLPTGRFSAQESPISVQAPGTSVSVASAPGSVAPASISHLVHPRSRENSLSQSQAHAMDYVQPSYHHRPSHDEGDGGACDNRYSHSSLMSIPSINSLKRGYAQMDSQPSAPPPPSLHAQAPAYTEMVHDLRDEYGKPSHDHKLLSFQKAGEKHTIVDAKGRMQEIEIEAQLHGMFFLSELSSSGDGNVFGAELTCYRRNLFQISGTITFPYSPLSILTASGESSQIKNMELSISATESVDGHPVRLIVIPWKTPPPNSPEVTNTPDQEPPSLPLIPCQDPMGTTPEESAGDEYAVHPIGWRRLQFRIATANNGRRKELQQHFLVHLRLHGTLANGTKILVQEMNTAPIVVRGRSPRNFQARKEIPLLGSSAGSRGQTLVESGHGMVAQAYILNKAPWQSRPKVPSLDLPRTAFTFNGPKGMPASPLAMRSNSYPTTWGSTHHGVSTPAYTGTSVASEPYGKMPLPGYSTEPQEMQPMQASSMPSVQLSLTAADQPAQAPIRTQYATYVNATSAAPQLSVLSTASTDTSSLTVPRYVDSSPRANKSPRHSPHPSVHSSSSLPNDASSGEYRYGPSTTYAVNNNSGEISPHTIPAPLHMPTPHHAHPHQQHQQQHHQHQHHQQQQQHHQSLPAVTSHVGLPDSASGTASARDYFPPSQSWTSTAGEPVQPSLSYGNGSSDRSYSTPYVKPEVQLPPPQQQLHHGPSGPYPTQAMSHYTWNAT